MYLLTLIVLIAAVPSTAAAPAHGVSLPTGPGLASFVDPRDGRRYRTSRVERIEWMRDNLADYALSVRCVRDLLAPESRR